MAEKPDKEYASMQRAQRDAIKKLKQNGYRQANVAVCLNCKHSGQMSIEDVLTCSLLSNIEWTVNTVDGLHVCNKYEPKI